MSLTLCMIVKNEAARIRETLESVKPFVDSYAILDTGSTDGTVEIVREVMQGVPGVVREAVFIDYATTRNDCFDAALDARVAERFFLVLSGDEVLVGGAALRLALADESAEGFDAFSLRVRTERVEVESVRVIRSTGGWRYEGEVHEVLQPPSGVTNLVKHIDGAHVEHKASDPERRAQRLAEYDVPVLKRKIREAAQGDEYSRLCALLAETYCLIAEGKSNSWEARKNLLGALDYFEQSATSAKDAEAYAYGRLGFVRTAATLGYYTPSEAFERVAVLDVADTSLEAEASYLAAWFAVQANPEHALAWCMHAVEACRNPPPAVYPRDAMLFVKACALASRCAKAFDLDGIAEIFTAQGLAAGGPVSMFGGVS